MDRSLFVLKYEIFGGHFILWWFIIRDGFCLITSALLFLYTLCCLFFVYNLSSLIHH